MCLSKEALNKLTDDQLLQNFKKSIELDIKSDGNGKSPFDQKQLLDELTLRLQKPRNPNITIEKIEVINSEPRTKLLQVTVDGSGGQWKEIAHTEREAWFFLRGIKAITSFGRDFHGLEFPNLPSIGGL